jgi:hypothetical protein
MLDYWKRGIVFRPAKAARKSVRFEGQAPFLLLKEQTVRGEELSNQIIAIFRRSCDSGIVLFEVSGEIGCGTRVVEFAGRVSENVNEKHRIKMARPSGRSQNFSRRFHGSFATE